MRRVRGERVRRRAVCVRRAGLLAVMGVSPVRVRRRVRGGGRVQSEVRLRRRVRGEGGGRWLLIEKKGGGRQYGLFLDDDDIVR